MKKIFEIAKSRIGLEVANIALDPGTDNTVLVRLKPDGSPDVENIFDEPSVIVEDRKHNRIPYIGHEAKMWIDRVPEDGGYRVIQPIRNGEIQHLGDCANMWGEALQKSRERLKISRRAKINLIIAVRIGLSDYQERTYFRAARMLVGVQKESVKMIDQVFCAVHDYYHSDEVIGNMGLDIGAGNDQIILFNGCTLIPAVSDAGGNAYTQAIVDYCAKPLQLAVEFSSAEDVKLKIGAAKIPDGENDIETTIAGRDLVTNEKVYRTIKRSDIVAALAGRLSHLVEHIEQVSDAAPPRLAHDLKDPNTNSGLILAGGGTELPFLSEFLTEKTGYRIFKVQRPFQDVAIGAARHMNSPTGQQFIRMEADRRKKKSALTTLSPFGIQVVQSSSGEHPITGDESRRHSIHRLPDRTNFRVVK